MKTLVKYRSRFPEIIAELPIRSEATCLAIATETAANAQAKASGIYQGEEPFHINAERFSGTTGGRAIKTSSGATTGAGIFADWYWFFGEFGTTNQAARPFMTPAFHEALATVGRIGREAFTGL